MNHPLSEYRSEKWREIPENPRYLISSMGRVIGIHGKPLRQHNNTNGYPHVRLRGREKYGRAITRMVHVLVAHAFIGPRPADYHCCHLNDNREDARLVNLKYATREWNMAQIKRPKRFLDGGIDKMAKQKTSVSISGKTMMFLNRHKRPTSTQIDLDASLLAEILRLVDGDSGDCPLGRQVQSIMRSQGRDG